MLDIETLRIIWWGILGFLLIGFAIMDGFDLGVAFLLPFVTRNDTERVVVLNTIRPFWEGNQVWIILGAGAIFAAWPYVYAVAFSGAYFAVLLLLLTMGISRPVSFKYRSKLPNYFWRRFWDWSVFVGGLVPALIFGILMGNVLTGLPFYFDSTLRIFYQGTFWQLLNPFSLWCGLTSLAMLVMHGGVYLAMKTEAPIRNRAIAFVRLAAILLIILFAGGGVYVAYMLDGYVVLSGANPMGVSNPLHKEVTALIGGWLRNYSLYPLSMLAPILGFAGALGTMLFANAGNSRVAFLFSSLAIIGVISTVGVSMYPFLLPSSLHLTSSLLIWDASSTRLTLLVMLFAMAFFMPLILIYTAWVYRALRGKVRIEHIHKERKHPIY